MFVIATLKALQHNDIAEVRMAACDAVSQLQCSGDLGEDGVFLISSTLHNRPGEPAHITARVFDSLAAGGKYLGGAHFQVDGSPPKFWRRVEHDPNNLRANLRQKKDWNTATFAGEKDRCVILRDEDDDNDNDQTYI